MASVGGPTSELTRTREVSEELHFLDAQVLARLLRAREVSAVHVMEAFLGQIERVNPRVNAIPTLRPREELLEAARKADRELARREPRGALLGLPIAVKDVTLTKDIRTTYGSRIYQDFVPNADELYVERFKQAGAIIIGKTNTSEFGAGSQTFNEVFGTTHNPWAKGGPQTEHRHQRQWCPHC